MAPPSRQTEAVSLQIERAERIHFDRSRSKSNRIDSFEFEFLSKHNQSRIDDPFARWPLFTIACSLPLATDIEAVSLNNKVAHQLDPFCPVRCKAFVSFSRQLNAIPQRTRAEPSRRQRRRGLPAASQSVLRQRRQALTRGSPGANWALSPVRPQLGKGSDRRQLSGS